MQGADRRAGSQCGASMRDDLWRLPGYRASRGYISFIGGARVRIEGLGTVPLLWTKILVLASGISRLVTCALDTMMTCAGGYEDARRLIYTHSRITYKPVQVDMKTKTAEGLLSDKLDTFIVDVVHEHV